MNQIQLFKVFHHKGNKFFESQADAHDYVQTLLDKETAKIHPMSFLNHEIVFLLNQLEERLKIEQLEGNERFLKIAIDKSG